MGKWNGRRRKPRNRKIIRRKPESFAAREYRQYQKLREQDQELEECEQLDKRMRLEGQMVGSMGDRAALGHSGSLRMDEDTTRPLICFEVRA